MCPSNDTLRAWSQQWRFAHAQCFWIHETLKSITAPVSYHFLFCIHPLKLSTSEFVISDTVLRHISRVLKQACLWPTAASLNRDVMCCLLINPSHCCITGHWYITCNFTIIRCSSLVHFSLAVITLHKHSFVFLTLTISHFRIYTLASLESGHYYCLD